jgi:hypothetical protein
MVDARIAHAVHLSTVAECLRPFPLSVMQEGVAMTTDDQITYWKAGIKEDFPEPPYPFRGGHMRRWWNEWQAKIRNSSSCAVKL